MAALVLLTSGLSYKTCLLFQNRSSLIIRAFAFVSVFDISLGKWVGCSFSGSEFTSRPNWLWHSLLTRNLRRKFDKKIKRFMRNFVFSARSDILDLWQIFQLKELIFKILFLNHLGTLYWSLRIFSHTLKLSLWRI